MGVPAKAWMEDLLAAQQAGQEPDDPVRVRPDAAQIGTPRPLDQFPGHAAWLDNHWKLHRIAAQRTHQVRWELYNLADDPVEEKDVSVQQAEKLAEMRGQLESWLGSVVRSLNGEDY